jgi:nucleoporin NUP159
MGSVPPSDYYVVQRRQQAPFLFRKLPEVCLPFGVKRAPAYQFVARLRDFQPHLKDALIVSSTASTDLGLITRSAQPLTDSVPADEVTNVFTSTSITDEVRQAALPMTEASEETSTIGLGIDLSSTEKVETPILGADIAETPSPIPNILVLNNEGILVSWWFIYSESIRQGIPYHGLSVLQPAKQQAQQTQQAPTAAAPTASAFGSPQTQRPAFGQSAFGQSAFGTQTQQPAFGKPSASAAPSFGTPSSLGAARQPAFGAPSALGGGSAFGSTTAAPSFGSPSPLAQRAPQFAKSGFGGGQGSAPAFAQSSSLGQGFSAFASSAAGKPAGTGFSAFSNTGGFAALAAKPSGESPFAKTTGESPFAKAGQSAFGSQTDTSSAFGAPMQNGQGSKAPFGPGSGGFALGSTFKRDENAAEADATPATPSGAFSLGSSFGNLLNETPSKASPPAEAMDDMEDVPALPEPAEPANPEPAKPSLFGTSQSPVTAPPATAGPVFGTQSQTSGTPAATQTSRPSSLFGGGFAAKPSPSPLSSPSESTVVPSLPEQKTPNARISEPPLPPDATSRAVYGPGDTSASSNVSNVSRSSIEDAPLPPDFIAKKEPAAAEKPEEAPLPPDFLKKAKTPPSPKKGPVEDAALPPDFLPNKTTKSPIQDGPLPSDLVKPKSRAPPKEEPAPLPDESEGSEGDFEDSGEDVANDISPPSERVESLKTSPESSFDAGKGATGGFFGKISKPENQQPRATRPLFGEITKPVIPPPKQRSDARSPRSPSPVRPGARRDLLRPEQSRSISAPGGPGGIPTSRKATARQPFAQEQPLAKKDLIEEEESRVAAAEISRLNSEAESLAEDDEVERLRAELARPVSPVPILDPFLSRQEPTGFPVKQGVPGQIERLYRDINSMVDTLGINSRSMAAYLLYQESQEPTFDNWAQILLGENPLDIADEKLSLADISNFDEAVSLLDRTLEKQRLRGVQDKLDQCQQLLGRDIFTLRGQCASIQKSLDAYTDTVAIRSAPLSAEQANLQQDLRKSSAAIQSEIANLEQAVSLLRAKIADASRADGAVNGAVSRRPSTRKPTVEAVTSTIATMMGMAESKSSDIDVLEAQMKKLGIDVLGGPPSREGSPFTTPLKKSVGRLPVTPGSRGSRDDGSRSAYHTPESTNRFRSSINESARHSRLRSVQLDGESMPVTIQDSGRWTARAQRRQEMVGNLKKAIESKPVKVRSLDDL